MNPNTQNKLTNNSYNNQNKNINKNKTDMIRDIQNINSQKNHLNANNFEITENNLQNKKANNKPLISNNNANNKQLLNNNYSLDKNLNLSNTQDLTRHFSGNKIKKNDISNFSILSPKTQKEILNNKVYNANFNENLFQKNINLNVNNQTFEGNSKKGFFI